MIEIKNLKKSFLGLAQPVIDNMNFFLKEGDFCVIIGANGCGKSSLLKLISNDYTPDFGSVITKGAISQVWQDVNLGTIAQMSLLENIALNCINKPKFLFYSRFKNEVIKQIKELKIGLEEYLDSPLITLSGGQRQMIATLMAIHAKSKILLLDEHTSALDPNMQNILMEYTNEQINKYRLTTMMITHKMDDAIKYGNRLIMMHKGKIVFDVANEEKKSLSINSLLKLFHHYEDSTLVSGENNEH